MRKSKRLVVKVFNVNVVVNIYKIDDFEGIEIKRVLFGKRGRKEKSDFVFEFKDLGWLDVDFYDEIRLIADYVTNANYIYDDNGQKGGLKAQSRFVILGDLNASPEGDKARVMTTDLLLKNSLINASFVPKSEGSKEQYKESYAQNYTANWQARVDYVLPSNYGLSVKSGGVFWPTKTSEQYRLIKDRNASSDHRLVWLDLIIE